MIPQIPFDSVLWNQHPEWMIIPKQSTQELIQLFAENPDADPASNNEIYMELFDRMYDAGTIYPQFYLAFPYLAEIASYSNPNQAYHIWSWLGSNLAEGVPADYHSVPAEVIDVYEQWLTWSEKESLNYISEQNIDTYSDNYYLLGAPFSFVNPSFGYLSVLYDCQDYSATCPAGHVDDYFIDSKGIINSDHISVKPSNRLYDYIDEKILKMPDVKNHSWHLLLNRCGDFDGSMDVKRLMEKICSKGLCKETPMPVVIFLYANLLKYIGKNAEFADDLLKLLDYAICPHCNESFVFAERWNVSG